jgi:hypothetical protein
MKRVFLFLLIFELLYNNEVKGQKKYEREFVCISYSQDSFTQKKWKEFFIQFNDGFEDDSISVFLNNKLIYHRRISTDKTLSYADAFKFIIRRNSQPLLKFFLDDKKLFCEILYDKRCSNLKLSHISGIDIEPHWIANFANGTLIYE